jgi:hypothetical protein
VSPKNPRSSAQTSQRSILRESAKAYDALSDVQQQAWVTAAAKLSSKPTLGQSGPLTGLQLYVKVNAALLTIGAPTVSLPPAAPADSGSKVTGLTVENSAGTVTLKLTTSAAPPDGTMLWACAPQNSGVRRLVSPRYLGTLDSPGKDGTIDITSIYAEKFGAPVANQRVFVQVNTNITGYEGIRQTFSGRVPQGS